MVKQSKMAQHAVSAMSRLAEVYHRPDVWLSAASIARSRNLQAPVVAKILSRLAQAQLVIGATGPGGGYRLAHAPSKISLWDATEPFEPTEELACPYGPGWCGNHAPCPVHHSLAAVRRIAEDYLRNTRLDLFADSPGRDPQTSTPQGSAAVSTTRPRQSERRKQTSNKARRSMRRTTF